jgi:hypothetical protein
MRCARDPAPAPQTAEAQRLHDAIEAGVQFFAATREPYAFVMLDVMHRRFGIAAFSGMRARYDAVLESEKAETQRAALLRLFRRIVDHENAPAPEDEAAVSAAVDRLTVPALYCDRTPLPGSYADALAQANADGAYMRTHALLALLWLRDNGCASPAPADYEAQLRAAVSELIAVDGQASDLELEAAGFLHLYGAHVQVPAAFVAEVVELQQPDGGWLREVGEVTGSSWHASVNGLFVLLHAYCGARDYPPMLAPAR